MKTKTLLRELKKAGLEVKTSEAPWYGDYAKVYMCKNGTMELDWRDNGRGDAESICIRDTSHVHNPQEDTCGYIWFPKLLREVIDGLKRAWP